MPIYTPRGLKVRLEPAHAFALMARLEPEVRPFRVLQTTEAIENAPSAFALLAALAGVALGQPPLTIGLATAAAGVVVAVLTMYGMFILPGMVAIGHVFSRLTGFGLLFIPFAVYAWFRVGWRAVTAYLVGRAVMAGLIWLVEIQRGRYYYRALGHPFTASEINFFSAYRLHAQRLGRSLDLNVGEDEQQSEGAGSLARFSIEWPQVAQRFS